VTRSPALSCGRLRTSGPATTVAQVPSGVRKSTWRADRSTDSTVATSCLVCAALVGGGAGLWQAPRLENSLSVSDYRSRQPSQARRRRPLTFLVASACRSSFVASGGHKARLMNTILGAQARSTIRSPAAPDAIEGSPPQPALRCWRRTVFACRASSDSARRLVVAMIEDALPGPHGAAGRPSSARPLPALASTWRC
jgi:hypothetical protein